MDYSQYENYGFDRFSAFNLSTGYEERSYQAHLCPAEGKGIMDTEKRGLYR